MSNSSPLGMTSRYSKALPPPPSDATPTSVRSPLPAYFGNAAFRASDELSHSPTALSPPAPLPISMPAPLRPSPLQRTPTHPSAAPRFSKISRIMRKPPPRVDSTTPSDTANGAEPRERSNAKFFLTRVRKKSSPPPPDVLPPDDVSTVASSSAYPGRVRNPVSDRVPVPMLGEEVMSEGGFLEETEIASPSPRRRHLRPGDLGHDGEMPPHESPGVASPISEVGEQRRSSPQSLGSTPRKRRGAVRFKIAGMVALGVQKMSAGSANLARRASLGSGSGSRRQSSARETGASPRMPEEPLARRLHAGPGGLFEPEPRIVHPAVRSLLERAASNKKPGGWKTRVDSTPPSEAEETESVSPVSPQSARTTRSHIRKGDRRRDGGTEHEEAETTSPVSGRDIPYDQWMYRRRQLYRDGASRLKDPLQGPSSISHEGPTTEDFSHERTYESSRPLVQANSSSRTKQSRRGGHFQRNAIGMDVFAEPVIEGARGDSALHDEQPKNDWEAITSLKRVLNAFFYLPLRSRSHATVSYIPARAKPDGSRAAELWYTPKPPKPPKSPKPPKGADIARRPSLSLVTDAPRNRRRYGTRSKTRRRRSTMSAQPTLKVIERDPSRRSRYITQDHLLAGQPIQILSEDAPPVLIAPGGAPHLSHSQEPGNPHSVWFTQPVSLR